MVHWAVCGTLVIESFMLSFSTVVISLRREIMHVVDLTCRNSIHAVHLTKHHEA